MPNLMRTAIVPLAMAGLTFAACQSRLPHSARANAPAEVRVSNDVVNAFGIFGGAKVNIAAVILCAGRVPLANGTATVKDACFTGDTNIVVCTDTTTVSAVRCAPNAGALLVGGNNNDVIAYARMR
jgi:hypothetical protein